MKSLKIFSFAILFALTLVGCDIISGGPGDDPTPGDASSLSGEWKLSLWNETEPEFVVYIDFNNDGTFAIYQQVWSLDYELFEGSYIVNGDIVTGSYADGTVWACGYRFEAAGDTLTLYSQEDESVTSLYEKCEIPAEVKAEAAATRSSEVVPFL